MGKEHPDTLLSTAKYGWTLRSQGKYPEAEEACRRALEGMQKPDVLGMWDIDTLVTKSDLGSILVRTQKYSEAVSLLWGTPEALASRIGENSFDSIMAAGRLGGALLCAKNYRDAEKYFRIAMDKWTRLYGSETPATLDCTAKLGRALGKLEKFDEAVELLERALKGWKKTLSPAELVVQEIEKDILEIRIAKGELQPQQALDDGASVKNEATIDTASTVLIPHETTHLDKDPRVGRADNSSQYLLSVGKRKI